MSYIGNSPNFLLKGSKAVFEYTATAGQTVFTGGDDNSIILKALDDTIGVFSNGVRLVLTDDYTINTAGDTVTLTSAAALNDIIVIETLDEIANLGTYTKAEADARYINTSGDITTGTIQVSGTNNNIELGTNNKVTFGGTDLEIYSDGTIGQLTGNINVTGNMGIGTSSPASKLHIRTSTNFNYEFEEVSSKLRISALNDARSVNVPLQFAASEFNLISGNVGIGETNPQHKLDIGGMADPTVRIKSSAGGDPTLIFDAAAVNRSARIKFYDNGSIVGGFIDYLHDGDKMNFGSGSSVNPTMTVADQAVGIGTQNPSTKLDVAGTITADQYNTDAALPTIRPSLLLDFANSKTLDPKITFTRSSSATYYDGKATTKAEENLITNSEAFGSWSAFGSNGTLTSGFTSPTGTSTAWRLQYPQSTGGTYLQQTFSTKVGMSYTMSVYAKENASGSQFRLRTDGGVMSSIFSTSSSWQRYSFTFTATLTTHMIEIDNTTTAAADILIWGAQVEENSHESVYIPTTSNPIVKYQPKLLTAGSDGPRFDHDPITGESKGLLIEEARTNYSGTTEPTGTYQATQRAEYGIAPDGTQTAIGYEVGSNTVGGSTLIYWPNSGGASSASGINVTQSVYVKPLTGTMVRLLDNSQNKDGIFLLSGDGSVTGGSATTKTITHVGNQWYRITMSYTMSGTASYIQLYTYETGLQGDIAFLTWGYQREIGSFATSFIKSNGGSSTTRSADQPNVTDLSWFNNQEGSFSMEGATLPSLSTAGFYSWWSIEGDSSGSENRLIFYNNNRLYYQSAASTYSAAGSVPRDGTFFKVAGSFKYGDSVSAPASFDGVSAELTGTNGPQALQPNILRIGRSRGDLYPVSGHIKKLAFFTNQFSQATLNAVTEE